MDIMNEVETLVTCKDCQWDKVCLSPPSLTKEEVDKRIEESTERGESKGKDTNMLGGLMAVMMLGGRDTDCKVCPIFANKLRSGPEMSAKIKEWMKEA